jgi:hypothetical protein
MQKQTAVNYSDGRFQPIIDKCDGCGRVVEQDGTQFCTSYLYPAEKWKLGICNFATHAKPEITVTTVRINPLKAAKRAAAKNK